MRPPSPCPSPWALLLVGLGRVSRRWGARDDPRARLARVAGSVLLVIAAGVLCVRFRVYASSIDSSLWPVLGRRSDDRGKRAPGPLVPLPHVPAGHPAGSRPLDHDHTEPQGPLADPGVRRRRHVRAGRDAGPRARRVATLLALELRRLPLRDPHRDPVLRLHGGDSLDLRVHERYLLAGLRYIALGCADSRGSNR